VYGMTVRMCSVRRSEVRTEVPAEHLTETRRAASPTGAGAHSGAPSVRAGLRALEAFGAAHLEPKERVHQRVGHTSAAGGPGKGDLSGVVDRTV
jgi:hypothetical protein